MIPRWIRFRGQVNMLVNMLMDDPGESADRRDYIKRFRELFPGTRVADMVEKSPIVSSQEWFSAADMETARPAIKTVESDAFSDSFVIGRYDKLYNVTMEYVVIGDAAFNHTIMRPHRVFLSDTPTPKPMVFSLTVSSRGECVPCEVDGMEIGNIQERTVYRGKQVQIMDIRQTGMLIGFPVGASEVGRVTTLDGTMCAAVKSFIEDKIYF